METEFIEGNKLIAEFKEGFINEKGQTVIQDHICKDYFSDTLRYHLSFNDLMPVVEKIETLSDIKVHISISDTTCNISTHRYLKQITKETKILAVWFSIVEFLKWYNERQK